MASDWDMLAGKADAVEPEEEQEDTIWRVDGERNWLV
jgi:hypothetical protein